MEDILFPGALTMTHSSVRKSTLTLNADAGSAARKRRRRKAVTAEQTRWAGILSKGFDEKLPRRAVRRGGASGILLASATIVKRGSVVAGLSDKICAKKCLAAR